MGKLATENRVKTGGSELGPLQFDALEEMTAEERPSVWVRTV